MEVWMMGSVWVEIAVSGDCRSQIYPFCRYLHLRPFAYNRTIKTWNLSLKTGSYSYFLLSGAFLLSFLLFVLALQDWVSMAGQGGSLKQSLYLSRSLLLLWLGFLGYFLLLVTLPCMASNLVHERPFMSEVFCKATFSLLYPCCSDFTASSLRSLAVACQTWVNQNKYTKFKILPMESCSASIKISEIPS